MNTHSTVRTAFYCFLGRFLSDWLSPPPFLLRGMAGEVAVQTVCNSASTQGCFFSSGQPSDRRRSGRRGPRCHGTPRASTIQLGSARHGSRHLIGRRPSKVRSDHLFPGVRQVVSVAHSVPIRPQRKRPAGLMRPVGLPPFRRACARCRETDRASARLCASGALCHCHGEFSLPTTQG